MPTYNILVGNLHGEFKIEQVQGRRTQLLKYPDAQVALVTFNNTLHILELSTGTLITDDGTDYATTEAQAIRNAYIQFRERLNINCPYSTLIMRVWNILKTRGIKLPLNKFEVITGEWDDE